ncbi:hypothetical protein BGX27_004608 [Mortierella sp. AM989]|nr:hypothetical protein BGX27_004608 [Mortierella sp. AM989]
MRIHRDPFTYGSRSLTPNQSHTSLNTMIQGDHRVGLAKDRGTLDFLWNVRHRASSHRDTFHLDANRSYPHTAAAPSGPSTPSMSPTPFRPTASQASYSPSQPPSSTTLANSSNPFSAPSSNNRVNGRRRALSDNLIQSSLPTSSISRLRIDTVRSSTGGSQSNGSLESPNQLIGVVVESLKTPTRYKGNGKTTFGGAVFEPEDSSEQCGVPWMLYRQRSHSAGAIPQTNDSPATTSTRTMKSTMSDGKRDGRPAIARSTSSNYSGLPVINPNNSSEYLSKIARVPSNGEDDDSIVLPSSLKAASHRDSENSDQFDSSTDDDETDRGSYGPTGSMRVRHGQFRSINRSSSSRTGGKSQFSAYRRYSQDIDGFQQQQNEGHGHDETMTATSRFQSRTDAREFTLTSLNVSTDSLNTATRTIQAMDGNQSQHFFNIQAQRVQQLRDVHMGGGIMAASNPSSIQYTNAPALSPVSTNSIHSVSSVRSQLATPSTMMTDSSIISSLSRSSSSSSNSGSSSSSSPTSVNTHLTEDTHPRAYSVNCTPDNYSNEKGDFYHDGQQQQLQQQQQQHYQHQQQQQQQCSNGISRYVHKSFAPITSFVSQLSTYTNLHVKKTSELKFCKSSKRTSGSSEPKLTSSLYFISGIQDLKRAKRRGGGRWSKNSNANSYTGPDPKAFFSNERTYMHWIKFGLLLGSLALTLLSFGGQNNITGNVSAGVYVGLFLVLVTMATLAYATAVFHLRHRWMIELRQDVVFYDRMGPTILFMALFLAYATNVVLTMSKFAGDYADDHGLNFYNDKPLDV